MAELSFCQNFTIPAVVFLSAACTSPVSQAVPAEGTDAESKEDCWTQ